MTKTVLITGASSGIGYATACLFQAKGWNVVAAVRSPEKLQALLPNVVCLKLDVTDFGAMPGVVDAAIARFGAIDGLVNNAGYALVGPFEACSLADLQRQFDTNVLGLMAMTQAVLPHFRSRRSGIVANVASIGGQMAFPLYSPYHGTKWAVEGFSDSLRYELRPFNIAVKIIEPGPIKTDFYDRSMAVATKAGLTDYDDYVQAILPKLNQTQGSPPEDTAAVIYRALTDGKWQLRYPAGGNANALIGLRKLMPDSWFQGFVNLMTK